MTIHGLNHWFHLLPDGERPSIPATAPNEIPCERAPKLELVSDMVLHRGLCQMLKTFFFENVLES
jgi:hypothetical protein